MKIFFLPYVAICFSFVILSSCTKDPDPDPVGTKTFTVDASAFDKWKYFSFETGKEVSAAEVGNYEESKGKTNWDIAFHRGDMRTNSGVSGPGSGGALKANGTTMESITVVPTTGYTVDVEAEIIIEMSATGYVTQSKNRVLEDWYSGGGSMPPVYTVNDYTYVVKTASGKYAKIKFTDYMNDEGTGGHITFKYQYPVE